MRNTFTLLVEFRDDMWGYEQLKVAIQIQAFAEKQDIQTFGYESGNSGIYVFMAHPVLVNEKEDGYKIEVFRETLDSWLMLNQDINSFTLQPVTELGEQFPRVSNGEVEQVTNIADLRSMLLKTISK